MKKRGKQASSIGKMAGGGLVETVWTYYAVVGCNAPHKKNSCYFDPKKMTDRREWARKMMDEKGAAYKYDEWWWGTEQTVVHIYTVKVPLLYEASLICSPTLNYIPTPDAPWIIPQQDTGIVDSGATHLYIAPSAPHGPPDTSDATISVGTENGQVEK